MDGELSGGKNGIVYERIIKTEPMNFTAADIAMAFITLLCGFLYWDLIKPISLGFGVTLFAAVLCTASVAYFRAAGYRQTRASLVFLGIIALSAVNFTLYDGILIKSLNFIFLSACFVYWVCITAGMRVENRISLYILSDMLRQLFVIPFCNFAACFSGVRQVFMKSSKGKGVLGGILGVLLFLPVLALVISLLINADAAFESLMDKLQFYVLENTLQYLLEFILGLPVACYLYGMIYGNRYKRKTGNFTLESVNEQAKALQFAPGVTVYSALTALNLIYAVFFLSQTTYFFSAFRDSLPLSMTYAEYARRGFFELCTVSGINFGVIALAHLIAKRDKTRILRAETAVLCIFTIALIATAMSKMGMYIDYYGLTRLRVYTSWFMIVLLFLFVLVLLRQFKSFNGTRIAAAGCILLFLALCYGNVDGMIAKYNIDRYQAGTLENLDVSAFTELSDGAVPYLYQLYKETADPDLKAKLKEVIDRPAYGRSGYKSGFRDFNLQKYTADQIRGGI